MHRGSRRCRARVLFLIVVCLVSVNACDGTEARGKADRAVERLSGKDHIQQMDQMKSDIDQINKGQAGRIKQMEQTE